MAVRTALYARQSLDRTGEGEAVERQLEDCRKLAESRGWDVVEVLTDNDISASSGKPRPGYARLLELIETGAVDRVVAWSIDRLTRRLRDNVDLADLCESAGARISTVRDGDMTPLHMHVRGAFAQDEMRQKGARQRRANEQRAKRGDMRWARRPFGYDRRDGRIVTVPAEAQALQDAAQRVLDGSTLAAAARALDATGTTTSAGMPWNVTSLRRALLNPRYSGRVLYKGADVTTGSWPVILDGPTQDRLAEVLRDPRRRVQQGTTLKYLLSGYARCGRCGTVMFATPVAAGGVAYRCRGCYVTRRADLVDAVVEAVIVGRLERPDAAQLLADDRDVVKLRARAAELRQRRDELAGLLADGLLTATAVRARAEQLRDELEDVEGRLAVKGPPDAIRALVTATEVRAAWDALGVRDRRRVVELLATVTIRAAARRGALFDPQLVAIEWKRADTSNTPDTPGA